MAGSRVDSVEKAKRLRIIQEWLIDDWSVSDVKAEIIRRWELSDPQARKYIYEARDTFNKKEDVPIENKRIRKIETLKKLKRSLKAEYAGTPKGINAILNVEKEIIRLEGLEPTKKVDITTGGKEITPSERIIETTLIIT